MHSRLVGPIVLVIGVIIGGLAAIPYYGAKRLDADIRQSQETLVQRNLASWITDIEFSLTAWSIWDDSIARIDNNFDFEWVDRNIGSSLIGTSRTRFVAILDASDQIIYSKTSDEVRDRPFFLRPSETIVAAADSLVRRIRTRTPAGDATGIPEPVSTSRIEVLGNEAVLLTASLFQSDFGTAKPKGRQNPVLITAMPIGNNLQEFFGNRFLLDDPQVGPLELLDIDRARADIAIGEDGKAEVLSWRSPTPARDLLHQTIPLIALVSLVLLVGA